MSAVRTYRSCTLPCPCCGEAEANIALYLGEIGNGEEFMCQSCNTTFSIEQIERILATWPILLDWLRTLPASLESEEV